METDRSIAAVLSDIVSDIQQIVRAEVRLAKVEVRDEVSKAKTSVAFLAAGAVLALLALGFALLGAVYALALVWPLWAAALTVAAAVGLTGGALLAAGTTRLKAINIAPPRTTATLEENLQWAKTRTK